MITRECDRCHKKEVLLEGEYPRLSLHAMKDVTKILLPWKQVCEDCRREISLVIDQTKAKYWSKYERQAVEEIKNLLVLRKLKS